jgi:hypothetical protein
VNTYFFIRVEMIAWWHRRKLSNVDTSSPLLYPKTMEVHFTPEQEAAIIKAAGATGTDAERLVKDATLQFVDDANFRTAVLEALQQKPSVWDGSRKAHPVDASHS